MNTATGNETTNTWDHRNRLTKVAVRTSGNALIFEERYTYDVLNRRIGVWTDTDGAGTKDGGTQKWTAYDHDNNAWADFDASGKLATRYLNGLAMDQRFARYDVATDKVSFYLTDNINSVRQIVDINGNVQFQADYGAFGTMQNQSGTGGDRFTFTGRELDATGQYYYRARYYGAGVGRFASEDPIGFRAKDSNLFRYAGNSAIDFNDPSGLFVDSPSVTCRRDPELCAFIAAATGYGAGGGGAGTATMLAVAVSTVCMTKTEPKPDPKPIDPPPPPPDDGKSSCDKAGYSAWKCSNIGNLKSGSPKAACAQCNPGITPPCQPGRREPALRDYFIPGDQWHYSCKSGGERGFSINCGKCCKDKPGGGFELVSGCTCQTKGN